MSLSDTDDTLSDSDIPSDPTANFTTQFAAQLQAMEAVDVTEEEQEAIAALPSGSALLIVRRGPNQGARFLLDTDSAIAGRHPNADIFLDDVTVSRRHSEFTRQGTDFYVADMGSLNGTFYEGERVDDKQLLADGAEVQVGKYRLTFFASRIDLARNLVA